MSLTKLSQYHRDMAVCEVMGWGRAEILERFSGYVSSIEAVHRIMNDPMVKGEIERLNRYKVEKAFANLSKAEDKLQEEIVGVVEGLIELSKSARSESVRAKASRDLLWIGGMKPKDEREVERVIPHLAVHDSKKAEEEKVQNE